jgi:hypothetical protein
MWMSFAQKDEPVISPEQVDPEITQLLTHRYADGLVYLGETKEQGAFLKAMSLGLINAEGYLTLAGRSLMVRFDSE